MCWCYVDIIRYTTTIWEQTCGCRLLNIFRFHVLNNISRVLDWCSLNKKTWKCQALIGLWFCTRTYMSWTTDGVFTWGPQWQRILVVPFIFFNVLTPYYQNDNEWGYLHEYMVLNNRDVILNVIYHGHTISCVVFHVKFIATWIFTRGPLVNGYCHHLRLCVCIYVDLLSGAVHSIFG